MLESQKLVGSGPVQPVQPVRWLRLCSECNKNCKKIQRLPTHSDSRLACSAHYGVQGRSQSKASERTRSKNNETPILATFARVAPSATICHLVCFSD